MNKRHYEHTLPNIRGSLSNTYGQLPKREALPADTYHARSVSLLTTIPFFTGYRTAQIPLFASFLCLE